MVNIRQKGQGPQQRDTDLPAPSCSKMKNYVESANKGLTVHTREQTHQTSMGIGSGGSAPLARQLAEVIEEKFGD